MCNIKTIIIYMRTRARVCVCVIYNAYMYTYCRQLLWLISDAPHTPPPPHITGQLSLLKTFIKLYNHFVRFEDRV